MKKILVLLMLALALSSGEASAARVAKSGTSTLRLSESVCSEAVAVHIPPELRSLFHAADLSFTAGPALERHGAGPHPACWAQVGDQVFIIGDDGSTGVLDDSAFKDELSALNPPDRYPERRTALNKF